MTVAFDVTIELLRGKDLPIGDWISSDPYVEITLPFHKNVPTYRSFVKHNTLEPEWNETIRYNNLTGETRFTFEVKDKDFGITADDTLGLFTVDVSPERYAFGEAQPVEGRVGKKGVVYLKVTCERSSADAAPGVVQQAGPVRCRVHKSALSGVVTNNLSGFALYKLFLHSVPDTMGEKQHWNEKYPAAQKIFSSPVVMGSIRAQHSGLYKSTPQDQTESLECAHDFFNLLDFGRRAGQMRYYTYVILEDSMRFSETGTAFFNDMLSKHALHASAAPEVFYAGEFCVQPIVENDDTAGFKLIIDNNSGTYAPKGSQLSKLQKLFQLNFPDMLVETIDSQAEEGKSALEQLHSKCPSRRKTAS